MIITIENVSSTEGTVYIHHMTLYFYFFKYLSVWYIYDSFSTLMSLNINKTIYKKSNLRKQKSWFDCNFVSLIVKLIQRRLNIHSLHRILNMRSFYLEPIHKYKNFIIVLAFIQVVNFINFDQSEHKFSQANYFFFFIFLTTNLCKI